MTTENNAERFNWALCQVILQFRYRFDVLFLALIFTLDQIRPAAIVNGSVDLLSRCCLWVFDRTSISNHETFKFKRAQDQVIV